MTHSRACAEDALFCQSRITGKERDTETGLDYFGSRYYSPSAGRFSTPDAILINAKRVADPQLLNLFSYVGSNPLGYVDPNGNERIKIGSYIETDWHQHSEEIGRLDWLFALAGVGGSKVGARRWMDSVGRDQDPFLFAKPSAGGITESGAWFGKSYKTVEISVDFREDPGAGWTAKIEFKQDRNVGVVSGPTDQFDFRSMDAPTAEWSGAKFDFGKVSDQQLPSLSEEAWKQFVATGDVRYQRIWWEASCEANSREEEKKKKEKSH